MIDTSTHNSVSPRLARVEGWMPGLRTLRTYKRAWLPRDLVAGVVLSALLVPQGMAYAELAGLPRSPDCIRRSPAWWRTPFLVRHPI